MGQVDEQTKRRVLMWDDIEFLGEFAELDGTEWGEMVGALCIMAGRIDMLSDEMADMLMKEIADNAEYVRAHAKIVETTETYTRTTRDIEWDK